MEESMADTLASHLLDDETTCLFAQDNLPSLADVEHLRWKVLIDSDGEKIGTIESIKVDEESGRVEFVEVGRGGFLGFGTEHFLVPITRIVEIQEKTARIDRPSTAVEGAPPYDPERLADADYCAGVRNWWRDPANGSEGLDQGDSISEMDSTPS